MSTAGAAAEGFDAGVDTGGEPTGQLDYLQAVAEQDAAAVDRVEAMIKDLKDGLPELRRQAAKSRAAARRARDNPGGPTDGVER